MEIRIADKDTLDKVAIALGVSDNKIYGIKINKKDSNPDTRCTYLGDAVGMKPAKMNFETGIFSYGDWADVWFVRDNFPCMLDQDGSVVYKLNPNDYSLKEDGTASDIYEATSPVGNVMSAMPTVWIWQYEIGDFKYIWLANYKVNDNYKAYAHQRPDGTIAPYLFMSAYKGSLENGDSNANKDWGTKLFSLSRQYPLYIYNATEEGTVLSWLDSSIWRRKTWLQRNLMQCLITMIICSTDASSKLGCGFDGKYDITGTLDDKGQFWGSLDGSYHMKAFHQEDVWGNYWDKLDGYILKDGIITLEDKYAISIPRTHGGKGHFSNSIMTEFGDFPTDVSNGSYSTYECSMVQFSGIREDERRVIVGGGTRVPIDDTTRTYSNLYAYDDAYGVNAVGATVSLSCLP